MKRFSLFLFFILISPVIAGLYGILVDEISYVLDSEFYTKFRFRQLPFPEKGGIWEVAVMGWNNSWRLGFLVGLPLSIIGLFHRDEVRMRHYVSKSFLITLITTIISGFIGILSARYILTEKVSGWTLPDGLSDPSSFMVIETFNNFNSMGATVGMLLAILWQLRQKRKDDKMLGYPIM
jgi:hypothetical protein